MFLYDKKPKEKSLFVKIPSKIRYNFAFLNSITELLEQVEKSGCEKILIDCGAAPINYNKMCAAYLLNTLLFLVRTKTVFAKNNLLQIFTKQYHIQMENNSKKLISQETHSVKYNSVTVFGMIKQSTKPSIY